MSRYGDLDKENLFEEIQFFLCGEGCYTTQHKMWELMEILSDVVSNYEDSKEYAVRAEIESEYKGYKEKYESMSKIING